MGEPGRKPIATGGGDPVGCGWVRRLMAVACFGLALLCLGPAAQAQNNISPRGAAHDGYGRIVIDWDEPVTYSADVISDQLVLRFDRPVSGDFHSVLKPLSHYLRGVSVSDDRRTATFPLARPLSVKAFTNANGATVVDLVESAETATDAAPPPDDTVKPDNAPVSLLPPPPAESPARPSAKAAAKPGSPSLPEVSVRSGEHGAYNRLVFDWPKEVNYKVEQQGGKATITFDRPGHIDVLGLQLTLPSDIAIVGADTGAKSTTVTLNLPPEARLRHFASGSKVAIDVVRAADAKPPTNTPSLPLAPSPGSDMAAPSLKPLGKQEPPKLPSETLAAAPPALTAQAAPPKPEPAKAEPPKPEAAPAPAAVKAEPLKPEPAAPPPAVAGPSSGTAAPAAAAPNQPGFSLSVSWDKPAAAAVFQRAGYLWMVFDRHQEVDTKLLRRLGGEAVSFVEQLTSRDATVLRLIVQPDYFPSVRRDGLLWVVDLTHQQSEPKDPIAIQAPVLLTSGVGMNLTVQDSGSAVSVTDPEVGDTMLVVPVLPPGAGVYPGREAPEFDLLPTVQGIALVPHSDGVDAKPSRSGVAIYSTSGQGLRLSPEGNAQAAHKTAGGFFDIATWQRSGLEHFADEAKIVEDNLVNVSPAKRTAAHMEAAQFFFANGYAAEALGYLKMALADEPTLIDNGPFRALRGAANAEMERWDLALPDLDSPVVKGDPEAALWRAAAHAAASENPGEFNKDLAAGLPLARDYQKPLKWPLAATAATAALAIGDDAAAAAALGLLDKLSPSPIQQGRLDYLHGVYDELTGQFDKAVYDYDKAIKGENREFRARAGLANTELELKMKKIEIRDAVDRLDRLRFAWRDENFEFGLLKRLGELQIQNGDYPDALRALRLLANNYPDNKDSGTVAKMMSDTFAKLYLDGAADTMPPISAIGLYDEFRDLTPTGPKGDEMIRKLADRLATVDLLDRAAELLKHQVNFRLQGLDKARIGAQLALLDLLNQQPQEALDALQASAVDNIPAELAGQRRHLQARALADVDRVPEGAKLLDGDASQEAALLRAEIYWRKQDWPNAAAAFENLVTKPERGATLDDASARLVLNWATALSLANDERGLASLRRSFAPAMAGTPYNDGFTLLTSALDRDVPDMPGMRAKIKEAEGFQSFMSNYRKRLQTGGLSGIN
jgi:tetratricopeptide (TPR) repeat protein